MVTVQDKKWNYFLAMTAILSFVILARSRLVAQDGKPYIPPGERAFTLEEAVDFALKNYPAVRAELERVGAARAGISLAKTSYLPRLDALWQSNRATRNNIFGLLLPQSVIPSISGPVLSVSNGGAVWGSAGGMLLSWEPFDFGARRAAVEVARSAEDRASAEAALTRLDIAAAATDAFLTLLAAQETVQAAQADVDRRKVFADSLHVLVTNQLRPGADASRADAELAAARTQLYEADARERISRATFAAILGIAGTEVKIQPGPLLGPSPESAPPAPALSAHPFAFVARARIEESSARARVLARSYFPRFNIQSALSARGSDANTDSTVAAGLNGLGLERGNWAAGMTITFPFFDYPSLRARKQIEAANERAEEAHYDQALQDLTGQSEKARAAWEGARRVAENTPIQLQAARDTEAQARARYQAGLSTIVEVADAQRLLVQAEIADTLARLTVWRTLAQLAAAEGDLEPFLRLVRARSAGGP